MYVSTSEGEEVGFFDLLTGESIIERAEIAAAFHEATRGYQGVRSPNPPLRPRQSRLMAPRARRTPLMRLTTPSQWSGADLAVNWPG